ncbi:unknown [Eubacterium sp. CAG:180]|jgi:hypothetical protein|nr:unknown [Eubacterium sp. CAG:180]
MIYSICRANDGNTILFCFNAEKSHTIIYIIYGVGVTELFSRKKLYIFADMELKTLYVV